MANDTSMWVGAVDRTDAPEILARAAEVGQRVLGPNAVEADTRPVLPPANFAALAEAGLLGLSVPREYGGLGADPVLMMRVYETLARYCAVTAFLMVQHVGVCGSIAAGVSPLAPTLLPALARGELRAGIGAAQLRRAGAPMLRAAPVDGGYRLDGKIPWASGYGLMTHLAIGATDLASQSPIFFWVPFQAAEGLSFGAPMDLAVMRASATVAVTCDHLFVPNSAVIGGDRAGYWRAEHGGALTNPVAFLLGIGAACLEDLAPTGSHAGLAEELRAQRERFYGLQGQVAAGRADTATLDGLLDCRVATSALVLRIAAVTIAASGGGAHLRVHPAQRHLRETSFFLTTTVNAAVRQALVDGL